ncbi:maleylpyruvate isomerase family mycothiol-dependent enzyme [Streptomyces roseifaciens]|uniref:maleylpyruvate isomerase family mycothiol-dependent enzyme n=1 Tax=Streptomyces roseifaciens TaxID=1488406 RepID=UPI000717FFD2|nr:maleylpyruvate isomerase family mycothiol-dependent enzyme [Streptomyces roseifaciens]
MPPAQRKPRPRSYDPAKVRAAVTAQLAHVREAAAGLDEAQLALPTRLGECTVRELIAHIALGVGLVARLIEESAPPAREITAVEWVITPAGAEAGAGGADTALIPLLDGVADRFAALAAATPPDRLLAAPSGAIRLDDFLVTRCVELAVHTDDLAAALGTEIRYDRQALANATRLLADALAAKAPGGSVEVRIPPFAVVQCVAGPRHTRGTPPNVVETDPLTWLRLATGRTDWATALDAAAISASGERADISAQLPLVE